MTTVGGRPARPQISQRQYERGHPRFAAIRASIRRLWAEGLSTIAIARTLRITKNSVVGHRNRMGLPARPSPIRRGHKGLGAESKSPTVPPAGRATLPPLTAEDAEMPNPAPEAAQLEAAFHEGAIGGAAALVAAQSRSRAVHARIEIPKDDRFRLPAPLLPSPYRTCQFILNDKIGPGWIPEFCGKPSKGGKPYCGPHCDACYSRTPGWGQKL